MKRVFDRASGLQSVPSYYRPRRWRVRSRLKFLITRPRLRAWADRHSLIVGVVNVRVVEALEEHAREMSRALFFGAPRVFVGDREIHGVKDVQFRSAQCQADREGNVTPLFRKPSE